MSEIPLLLKPCEAEILPDKIAHHEWEHRFNLMVVKRLGPSLVPAEVVGPPRFVRQGDGGDRAQDQSAGGQGRDRGSQGQGRQARGGHPRLHPRRSTPLFLQPRLPPGPHHPQDRGEERGASILHRHLLCRPRGRDPRGREAHASEVVQAQDRLTRHPQPGQGVDGGRAASALNLAAILRALLRPFGNHVITRIGERPTAPVRGIPADIAWYAYSCSQCGYCVQECDQYYGRGWESQSPRGKWYWLREFMEGREKWDQKQVDTILVCTTCEMCDARCSASLPIEPSWMKLRGQLIQDEGKMTFPPLRADGRRPREGRGHLGGVPQGSHGMVPQEPTGKARPGKEGPRVLLRRVYGGLCRARHRPGRGAPARQGRG